MSVTPGEPSPPGARNPRWAGVYRKWDGLGDTQSQDALAFLCALTPAAPGGGLFDWDLAPPSKNGGEGKFSQSVSAYWPMPSVIVLCEKMSLSMLKARALAS
jgi:hypothetical protein